MSQEPKAPEYHSEVVYLKRIADDMKLVRIQMAELMVALREAESEVSEKMRRFIMYMHDLHDVCYMYESRGQPVPTHVLSEMERCDDRYRQLLEEAHAPGGTFEKVRRKMSEDPKNRWDHTRQLQFDRSGKQ
jgi:hypothetical protein